jgi:glucose/arabinose dehydrogenase
MLVTERSGQLLRLGNIHQMIHANDTLHIGEGGLQGIALHPNFQKNKWIYLYRTVKKENRIVNRVERYRLYNGVLTDKTIIIDDIPGAMYHDGGRIAFGPDHYLYITTGDAADIHSLAGKILRLSDDGTIPFDNPFGNAIFSYGHRNPQGLTWDTEHRLWSTEHGPSGFESGEDELNLIEKGQNYGWPIIKGAQTKANMRTPILQSGKEETWAPASALYWDGSIFFGGLRGEALYEARIDKIPIVLKEHFKGQFGRIRTVVLGPDGYFYLTTSNRDGRGTPRSEDDKIIKIDPKIFRY